MHKSLSSIRVRAVLDHRQRIQDRAIISLRGARGDRDLSLSYLYVGRIDNTGVNFPPGHVVEDLTHIFSQDES